MKETKHYAVARGRKVGIFKTWNECKQQVHRFPRCLFKSFKNQNEAREWLTVSASNHCYYGILVKEYLADNSI